ncbi:DUF397 domain-containing protein [Streptomyces sp. CBMA123]|uniref:DUF397 domain-containing protein n=1 Tax=Streptomyces sp. CBMA123 TaxID=1896313 RepID=UPI001661D29F|nr:DUF397 domain-containing protein [Streptomyces sp. CBMA123]MBD0689742.1 DUF397 domain-containing protein [Streptomyces sp. CBMA123]
MAVHNWQKSSYSGDAANCIYVSGAADGGVRIRESDDPDVIIVTSCDGLRAFLRGVKAGEFDHLAA